MNENRQMFLSVTKEFLTRKLSTILSKTLIYKELCKDAFGGRMPNVDNGWKMPFSIFLLV